MSLDIEVRRHTGWYSPIIKSMKKAKQFAVPKFETCGYFLYAQLLNLNAAQIPHQKLKHLTVRYRSISFHKRKGNMRAAVK